MKHNLPISTRGYLALGAIAPGGIIVWRWQGAPSWWEPVCDNGEADDHTDQHRPGANPGHHHSFGLPLRVSINLPVVTAHHYIKPLRLTQSKTYYVVGNSTGEGGFPTMWLEIQPLPFVGPGVVVCRPGHCHIANSVSIQAISSHFVVDPT